MKEHRKGTKNNPFKIGDKVRYKDSRCTYNKAIYEVVDVMGLSSGGSYTGGREWTPIMYKLCSVHGITNQTWIPCRYLEFATENNKDEVPSSGS